MRESYVCPKCGGIVTENAKFWGCQNYKDGCNYKIWKTIFEIPLSEKNLDDLLTTGETSEEVDGFWSKKMSQEFSAKLRYDAETNHLQFVR